MPRPHAPFAVYNRTVNPVVRGLLHSPFHRALSGRLALLTVTGRHSGRRFTIPVAYRRADGRVEIVVGWPERKRWWRNLRDGAPVQIRLAGAEHGGWAQAHGDERSGVTVYVTLDAPVPGPATAAGTPARRREA